MAHQKVTFWRDVVFKGQRESASVSRDRAALESLIFPIMTCFQHQCCWEWVRRPQLHVTLITGKTLKLFKHISHCSETQYQVRGVIILKGEI